MRLASYERPDSGYGDTAEATTENTPELLHLCGDMLRLYESYVGLPVCWERHQPLLLPPEADVRVPAMPTLEVRCHYWVHAPPAHRTVVMHEGGSMSLAEWVWLVTAYGHCVVYPAEINETSVTPNTVLGLWGALQAYTHDWTVHPWDERKARAMHDCFVAATVLVFTLTHQELSDRGLIGLCAADDPVLVELMLVREKEKRELLAVPSAEEVAAATPFSTAASAEIEQAARAAASLVQVSAFATDLALALKSRPLELKRPKATSHSTVTLEGMDLQYDTLTEEMRDLQIESEAKEYERDEAEMLAKIRADASHVDHKARMARSAALASEALDQWVPRCADLCAHINLYELLFERYPRLPLPKATVVETKLYREFDKWMTRRCAESFEDYRRQGADLALQLALPVGTLTRMTRRKGTSNEDMQTLFQKNYGNAEFNAFNDIVHKSSSSAIYANATRPGRQKFIRDAVVLLLYATHFTNRIPHTSFMRRYFIGTQHARQEALKILLQRMGTAKRTPIIVQVGAAYYVHDNRNFYEAEDIMHALWYWTVIVKEEHKGVVVEGEEIYDRWIKYLEAEDELL
jgi:hypothetical protein